MSFHELVPILQMAIGPVILISGVGLVLLSITNRYGRLIDRSRALSESILKSPPEHHSRFFPQLDILYTRARLLRLSISLASLSVLLAAVLVITIFLTAFFQWEMPLLIVILFIACLASLIGSLIVFIKDINISLAALKYEIEHTKEAASIP